jgi:hypothetical protein
MDFANLISGCNVTPGVTTNAAGQLMAFNWGRNRFYGPGITTVDFSLFKNFSFRERFKVQFRSEFFNVFNHPNFAAPNFLNDANNSIGTGNAGVIGSTSTASRQIQLGLKLAW